MKHLQKDSAWKMTEGSPAKLILRFAMPLLIGNLFQQFYSIVDAAVVGRFVGENEFGGIGCTGSIDYLIFSLGYGMSAGIGVLVAMMYGAGEKERLTKAIYNSAYILFAVSAIITLVGVFGGPFLLTAMHTPKNLYPHALLYLRLMSIGSTGSMFYGGISSVMRSFGDSRTPLLILLFSCVLNIALDLLFVLVLDLRVFGVAFATMIANFASAVISYIAALRKLPLFRYRRGALRPDKVLLKRTIRLGTPLAGQNMMIALSCMALQFVVNGFDDVIVTANTAVSKIDQLVQQPFGTLATALSAYTGQNIGAHRGDRVKQGLGFCVKIVAVFSVAMVFVMQFGGKYILSVFVDDPEIIAVGQTGLRITSSFYIFLGMLYVIRGVLNGAGDAMYSGINGIIELVCRFGLAAPLTMIPFVGQWGIFLCSGMTWMITALISFVRYHTGSWKKALNRKV
ncbi:MAG: MATE family efflux transporter [Faecousia sp.]